MKKNVTCLFMLISLLVMLCGCGGKIELKEVPFTLNTVSDNFHPPQITLIKSNEEFGVFLNDESIFDDELSSEFQQENNKYDSIFFESNDLIAIIIQAPSSQITGYHINKITKENQDIIIHIEAEGPDNVTSDMGKYYTYYFSVEKDDNIKYAGIKW